MYTYAASVVCSVKCIGSRFRLLVAVHIKANKMLLWYKSTLSQVRILVYSTYLIYVGSPTV